MNLDVLLAEREIYRQIMAFARAMDNREWQVLKEIMHDDASADLGMGEVTGCREIVAFIRSFLDKCGTTQHLIGNVIVDVTGNTATSRAYVSDMHLGSDSSSALSFRTLGEYHDQWILLDDSWLLKRRVKDNRATMGTMDVFS